jgi:GntR family transcriptional regulator
MLKYRTKNRGRIVMTIEKQELGGTILIYPGYKDATSLCEQIKEQMRRMIISYGIQQDEKLPAIPELSSRLAVNPNMVTQAFCDLEKEGYVYHVDGEGFFAADEKKVDEQRRQALFAQLDHVVIQLSSLSVAADELTRRVNMVAEGDRDFDRSK